MNAASRIRGGNLLEMKKTDEKTKRIKEGYNIAFIFMKILSSEVANYYAAVIFQSKFATDAIYGYRNTYSLSEIKHIL